jgi:hypothetical protein
VDVVCCSDRGCGRRILHFRYHLGGSGRQKNATVIEVVSFCLSLVLLYHTNSPIPNLGFRVFIALLVIKSVAGYEDRTINKWRWCRKCSLTFRSRRPSVVSVGGKSRFAWLVDTYRLHTPTRLIARHSHTAILCNFDELDIIILQPSRCRSRWDRSSKGRRVASRAFRSEAYQTTNSTTHLLGARDLRRYVVINIRHQLRTISANPMTLFLFPHSLTTMSSVTIILLLLLPFSCSSFALPTPPSIPTIPSPRPIRIALTRNIEDSLKLQLKVEEHLLSRQQAITSHPKVSFLTLPTTKLSTIEDIESRSYPLPTNWVHPQQTIATLLSDEYSEIYPYVIVASPQAARTIIRDIKPSRKEGYACMGGGDGPLNVRCGI